MKLSNLRILVWMLLAWPLPALLAHALGWHPIWGSGSVVQDYLLPMPVAAGVLHLPSFILCTIGFWQIPTVSSKTAGRLRALALGLALGGLLGLLRLDEAWLALRSGSSWSGALWQENPLALFVLTDAALVWLLGPSPAGPVPGRDQVRWLLGLCPGLAVLMLASQLAPTADDLLPGTVRPGQARGDTQWMVWTGQDMQQAGFEAQAVAWAQQWHQRGLDHGGDMVFLFTTRRDAAQRFEPEHTQKTLCLFDDETPPRWLPGGQAQTCFDGHLNFSEAVDAVTAALPAHLEAAEKHALARQHVCAERHQSAASAPGVGPCQ